MNFKLDPPSGFADSYLDIEFSVVIPKHPKTVVQIYNEISGDQLQILGTSLGYIIDGDKLILKNQTSVVGHINIFNHDKMNNKFLIHKSVTLKCMAKFYDTEDNEIGSEEESVVFYNEMHSLDADIIPFELIIHTKTVDITENESLDIDIISNITRKYELCISSLDEKLRCHIEIDAYKGKTSIEIPCEFLYYDLALKNNSKKKFKFLYVKYQGNTLSRMSNKRYLPILNSEFNFNILGELTPNSQIRIDPMGRILDKKFVISDRYLVMCPREFSGFARKSEFGPEKLMDLTMMINEGQHLNSVSKQMKQFEANEDNKDNKDSENINQTKKKIQLANQAHQAKQNMRRPKISSSQVQLMRGISKTYDTIISTQKQPVQSKHSKIQSFSANSSVKPKKGGCGCSRKRKKNE